MQLIMTTQSLQGVAQKATKVFQSFCSLKFVPKRYFKAKGFFSFDGLHCGK